jgi:CRP/FNR family transcriptional regulator, nitrogen fixation regulation protein
MFAGTTVQPSTRPFECVASKTASLKSNGLADVIEKIGKRRRFNRNAEIYGELEHADYFCKVVSGAVRTYKVVYDGRRLVGAFYLPGEVFGLEVNDQHLFSAEAVVDADIWTVDRDEVMSLASQDAELARDLWTLTASELHRTQSHMLLLNKSAPERVASFLLEMAERIDPIDEIQLIMSRQDVADYLGLTSETISRMLTRLQTASAIALPNCRRIVLRNRPVLKRMVA